MSSVDINNKQTLNNNSSLKSNSTGTCSNFSYSKAIISQKIPIQIPVNSEKNIRISKKNKKNNDGLDYIDTLYNKIQDYQRNLHIDRTNYILLIVKSMDIIENFNNLSTNSNKKDIVIKAINRLVMVDLDLQDFDKRLILTSVDNIIELLINCTKLNNNDNDNNDNNDDNNDNNKNNKNNKNKNNKNNNNKNTNIEENSYASCSQIIFSIVDKLITIVIKKQYTSDKILVNIATITEILMILTDKYFFLNCLEKKMIVIHALNIFIKEKISYIIEIEKNTKQDLVQSLDTVPMIIDLILAVKNGKYNINVKQIMKIKNSSCFRLCGKTYISED